MPSATGTHRSDRSHPGIYAVGIPVLSASAASVRTRAGRMSIMSRGSKSVLLIPEQVRRSLANLGESLAIARVRRKQSQRDWANRIGVSIPTLIKMERGDPSVGMSVYATALWIMGKSSELGSLAAPESDLRGATLRNQRLPGQRYHY